MADNTDQRYTGAEQRSRPSTTRVEAVSTVGSRKSAVQKRRAAPREQQGLPLIVRLLLSTLFIPLLSHFLTGTYTFGYGPAIQKAARNLWYDERNPLFEEKELTLIQLANYDGRPENPVYVSIGGDIYDVSANRRIYGTGGSYNMMAGRDASRAFITGCFETHLTHDLRGLSDKELEALDQWKSFFAEHAKYYRIGRAILPPIDPSSPIPPPCNDDAAPGAAAHASKPEPVKSGVK